MHIYDVSSEHNIVFPAKSNHGTIHSPGYPLATVYNPTHSTYRLKLNFGAHREMVVFITDISLNSGLCEDRLTVSTILANASTSPVINWCVDQSPDVGLYNVTAAGHGLVVELRKTNQNMYVWFALTYQCEYSRVIATNVFIWF